MNQEKLKKANFDTIENGDEIYVWLPKDYNGPKEASVLHGRTGKIFAKGIRIVGLDFSSIGYGNRFFDKDYLYYPPVQKEQPPVLIELEKAITRLQNVGSYVAAELLRDYFIKPENQYHPKWEEPQPVFEIGDMVITDRFKSNVIMWEESFRAPYIWQQGEVEALTPIGIKVHGCLWPVEALKLFKKAERLTTQEGAGLAEPVIYPPDASDLISKKEEQPMVMTEAEQQEALYFMKSHFRPFDLETARKMYKEGGTGKDVAMNYYHYKELEEKQLPKHWSDLKSITGWYIDLSGSTNNIADGAVAPGNKGVFPTEEHAAAALAMAQILQLRQEWLNIEASGWLPDWSDGNYKYCIVRDSDVLDVGIYTSWFNHLSFPTEELAIKFKNTFPALLKAAFCLPVN